MNYTILIVALLTMTNALHGQRVQASVISGGTPSATGTGVNLKVGTNNDVWDMNVAINISGARTIEEHLSEPDEEHRYTLFIPYVELSAFKVIAFGIAPYSPKSSGGTLPLLTLLTLSYPMSVYETIEIVPSFQLLFRIGSWLPGGFFGAGVAVSL